MYPVYFVHFDTGYSIAFLRYFCYDKVSIIYTSEVNQYMPYSEAQKKAVKKYNEKSYDEIKLRVKKGNKEIIQKYAESKNETVNRMINRLLESEIPSIRE
jgi:predicted HicB family RNase H-like nuclease